MASVRVILCLAVVALFAFVQMGEGLKCITCGPKCETNTTVTCLPAKDEWRCLAVFDDEGVIHGRGCGTEKECKLYADCSSCNEDECNSSPVTMPSFLIVGVASLVLAKYFY